MELIIIGLSGLVVGYYIGWHKALHDIEVELDREDFGDSDEFDEEYNKPAPTEKVIDTVIEYHQPYYLAYNAKNHSFLGQGKTFVELEEYLIDRYPDTFFEITTENIEALGL